MFEDKLLLVSQSPRRRFIVSFLFKYLNFLEAIGDEPTWNGKEPASQYLKRCLAAKWEHALNAYSKVSNNPEHQKPIGLLVADTTVALNELVFEKPQNPKHAYKMLKSLSGKTHLVLTAYRLGRFEGEKILADSGIVINESKVTFAKLSDKEIWNYIATKEPFDKAGGYGAQGAAVQFITKLEGSYQNVMGLPYEDLKTLAHELGFQ